jgi:hypothetical protein
MVSVAIIYYELIEEEELKGAGTGGRGRGGLYR